MARYIFITGGVVSSLGKGLASAALGALLQARGYKVRLRKLDPYINVDPGTMSPYQHGEVFVTDDGAETDLDLGHYERFTLARMTRQNNFTTGKIYEAVIHENAIGNHLEDHNMVIIHDPQPLPMIHHYKKNGPWIWRCHVDLSNPNRDLWRYLVPFIDKYDAVVLSIEDYKRKLTPPQFFFMPGIDPLSITNREMSEREVKERLNRYNIPTDLPLVVQISRFDRWKDPQGVVEAFRLARRQADCTLVLLGDIATDDPEGPEVYESLLDNREERIIILSQQDTALVNALQRTAAVVLQKSLREGFGLTVTEAMWKGAAVVGGNVGGICHQIQDGVNGFLVSSVREAAERIVQLVKDKKLRFQLGQKAKETVKKRFLLTRYAEQYLDLFNSFEVVYRLKKMV